MHRDKAYRISQRERVLKSRGKDAKTFEVKPKKDQIGRFSSRHPLDCGNSGCLTCHSSKVFGLATLKQMKDRAVVRDSMEDEEHGYEEEHEVPDAG